MRTHRISLPLLALVFGAGCGGALPQDPHSTSPSQSLIALQGTFTLTVSAAGPAVVGQPETFTIVATNPTANSVDNVIGSFGVLTLNGTAPSIKSSQGKCFRNDASQFFCLFGSLAAGASITVTMVAVPNDAGAFSVFSNAGVVNDETADQTTLQITPEPTDVQLTGSASNGSPARGNGFTYTFQVRNNGPFTADNVTFTDTLPDALPVGGVALTVSNALIFQTTQASCSTLGQTVSCALGTMPVGTQAVIQIGTTAPTTPQTIVDTASVSTSTPDRNPANGAVSVTVQIK
jgi:uncharacterized repeat protein (TIGR01451 family)